MPAMHSVIWLRVWTNSDNLEPRQMSSSAVKVDLKALNVDRCSCQKSATDSCGISPFVVCDPVIAHLFEMAEIWKVVLLKAWARDSRASVQQTVGQVGGLLVKVRARFNKDDRKKVCLFAAAFELICASQFVAKKKIIIIYRLWGGFAWICISDQ